LKPHGSHVTEFLLTELAESVTFKHLGSDSGDNPEMEITNNKNP